MPASTNPPRNREKRIASGKLLLWPLIALLLASAVIRFGDLDLKVSQAVYSDEGGWIYADHPVVQFFYNYGGWPAIAVSSTAALVWLLSCFASQLRPQRPLAIFLVLTMLLGPGLLVNAVFKEYWGRPRPRNVMQFGGDKVFAPLGEPRFGEKAKSFPSGHASMGFYWLVLGVYFVNRNRRQAFGFFALGLAHGALMGTGRILQGGHWLSDVFWAAGMDYLSAFIVLYLVPAARPPTAVIPAAESTTAPDSSPGD